MKFKEMKITINMNKDHNKIIFNSKNIEHINAQQNHNIKHIYKEN